jgi:N-acyl-D-aspartate/D-glutamate deacylase
MEQAIHKMTAMPAERLGIPERGILREGYYADILVFDPANFKDYADYLHPLELASGLDQVMVNGKLLSGAGTSAGRPVFRKIL